MRSSRFMPFVAAALMASAAAQVADDVVVIGHPGREPPPEPRREPKAPPTPRQLTEADNTRLRLAAEKRFRKAQRQAKGMVQ